MIGYVEAPITWGRVSAMAQRVGFDMPRAVLEGWLTRADLARMVGQCQQSNCAKGCVDVLAKSCNSLAAPPSFCALKSELEALAPPGH